MTRSARNHLFTIAEMLAVALSRSGSSCSADQHTARTMPSTCRADLTVARRERLRWRHPSLAWAELAL